MKKELIELMTKLDETHGNSTKKSAIPTIPVANIRLNNNYEWNSSDMVNGRVTGGAMNTFDIVNVSSAIANHMMYCYAKSIDIDDRERANELVGIIEKQVNFSNQITRQEVLYYFNQITYCILDNITGKIDELYDNTGTPFMEECKERNINISEVFASNSFGFSDGIIDAGILNNELKRNNDISYWRIDNEASGHDTIRNFQLINELAGKSAMKIFNYIHKCICTVYVGRLRPETIVNIMNTIVTPNVIMFHDSITDLMNILSRSYADIYKDLPYMISFLDNNRSYDF